MGRWAQAQRRGGAGPVVATLGPPPQPALWASLGDLKQTAAGRDDSGGYVVLYMQEEPEGDWVEYDRGNWSDLFDWGPLSELPACPLRATEIGNGTAYSGESAPSSPYDNS